MKASIRYKFGRKLRAIRERKGYTLKDIAAKTGVSESLVSQVERNIVSPSIDTLLLIADALNIDYEYLFSDYRKKRRVELVRAEKREKITRDKVTIHLLSTTASLIQEPAIEVFLLELAAAGEKGDCEYGHAGWELGIILEGEAELIYNNERYKLNVGDSIAFPSDTPHLFKNIGNTTLKAIWIVAPPRMISRN